ncbi:hypothetical protein [Micropruina glycogenica]|uniref:hypothetical protein n=1 Tax=Micropruina glycogenica TaxID=75385 RepID=UPI0013967185|nr:hypothetical protein [Micropruina glycogenica]
MSTRCAVASAADARVVAAPDGVLLDLIEQVEPTAEFADAYAAGAGGSDEPVGPR